MTFERTVLATGHDTETAPRGGIHVFYAPDDAARGEWRYQRVEDRLGMNSH